MGSLQAGKTSFTGLCPVVFIAWIPFISFDIQSSTFHSEHISSIFHSRHISSCKIHRTTHCKRCVYVPAVFADTGFSLPAPQPQQRRNFWLSTASGSSARDPAGSCRLTHAVEWQSLKKIICFPIIFIHYWHISSASPEYRWGNWRANILNFSGTFAWEQLLDLSLKYSIQRWFRGLLKPKWCQMMVGGHEQHCGAISYTSQKAKSQEWKHMHKLILYRDRTKLPAWGAQPSISVSKKIITTPSNDRHTAWDFCTSL